MMDTLANGVEVERLEDVGGKDGINLDIVEGEVKTVLVLAAEELDMDVAGDGEAVDGAIVFEGSEHVGASGGKRVS